MMQDSEPWRLNSIAPESSFSPWPHRFALLLACATFPLLFIGGLVTSLGAGLAVPDWPSTFGYNMFLYPWSKMIGGIFYEHSHRLVASSVGILTIALAWVFWTKEPRQWLRWLGLASLGLVIFQGVLGGLRVVLLQQTLAIVHACVAQIFFALAVSLVLFTSAEWRSRELQKPIDDGGRLRRLAAITTILIYCQIVFGAVLRHSGLRVDAHLICAALVAIHVLLLLRRTVRYHGERAKLVQPICVVTMLLVLQLILGGASYFAKYSGLLRWSQGMIVLTTTTHLIVGALMLVTSLVFTLRAQRLSESGSQPLGSNLLKEQFSV